MARLDRIEKRLDEIEKRIGPEKVKAPVEPLEIYIGTDSHKKGIIYFSTETFKLPMLKHSLGISCTVYHGGEPCPGYP